MIKRRTCSLGLRVLFLGGFCAPVANAGLLFSASLSWGAFSLRPLTETAPSPNYYGLGFGTVLGYSLWQRFDAVAFVDYLPASYPSLELGKEDANLLVAGGQLALRLHEQIYIGLKAGTGRYRLLHRQPLQPDLAAKVEAPGLWQGPAGGIVIGALHKGDKNNFWQLNFEIMHLIVETVSKGGGKNPSGKRRLDAFRLSASYTFNSYSNAFSHINLFQAVFR